VPQVAKTDEEIEGCFDVMSELRPHLKRDEFLSRVRQMESEGYRMAYIEEKETVLAVAGYRIFTNFYLGKHLYVDDLVTSTRARSKGHGQALIDWLRNHARSTGCDFFDLDSGTQRGRAHKFYFEQGFTIACYHFVEALDDS
jgi:GNAT superfamily N-acetyltransferase